jgi:hypothetical protein
VETGALACQKKSWFVTMHLCLFEESQFTTQKSNPSAKKEIKETMWMQDALKNTK